jgi:hypothetical protein
LAPVQWVHELIRLLVIGQFVSDFMMVLVACANLRS